MKHLRPKTEKQKRSQTRHLKLPTFRPKRWKPSQPILDENVSGMREDVQGKRGHAVADKHPEAQVVSDSDRGLHGDEIAQIEHVGASVVEPVV